VQKRTLLAALAAIGLAALVGVQIAGASSSRRVAAANPAVPSCKLANGIKHVIYLQFDNVHYNRDNPNVPSDLQQMPHLLNFLKSNGTLFTTTRSSSRIPRAGFSPR
jgi:hypothetical protein